MAYSEVLAERVRSQIDAEHHEITMFGGLAIMVNTHMAVGLTGDDLMFRVDRDDYDAALARGAEPMRMGERVMAGMVRVRGDLVAADDALRDWVGPAVTSALTRPPKTPKAPRTPRARTAPSARKPAPTTET